MALRRTATLGLFGLLSTAKTSGPRRAAPGGAPLACREAPEVRGVTHTRRARDGGDARRPPCARRTSGIRSPSRRRWRRRLLADPDLGRLACSVSATRLREVVLDDQRLEVFGK